MAGKDMTSGLANAAMQDPRVQQAARQEGLRQGRQFLASAQATYCESFMAYLGVIRRRPNVFPLRDTLKCRQENKAAYGEQFAKWNVIFVQLNILLFPIFVVFFLIGTVAGLPGSLFALVSGVLGGAIYLVSMLFFSQLSYYFVVEKGGCCGDCGYAVWIVIYALMVSSNLLVTLPGTWIALDNVMRAFYWITVLPAFYLLWTCWQLGGGAALANCCSRMKEAGSAAANRNSGGDAESGRARAPAPPPPSSNPANRLE